MEKLKKIQMKVYQLPNCILENFWGDCRQSQIGYMMYHKSSKRFFIHTSYTHVMRIYTVI